MKTKIKFSNGDIVEIKDIELKIAKLKQYLQKRTGLIYGKGDPYTQTIGVIAAWTAIHSPEHKDSDDFMEAAVLVMLNGLAEKTGGFLVYAAKLEEAFVYVPAPSQNFVVRIQAGFYEMLSKNHWDYSNYIELVTTIGNKVTVDELREQLKIAIEKENYELAAKLRDKINMRNKKT
jgi:hypothetical protein